MATSKRTTRAGTLRLKLSLRDKSLVLQLRILGYEEGKEWFALCLDMDLVGIGRTFDEAIEQLKGSIKSQFMFALDKRDPALLFFSAEEKYQTMYNAVIIRQVRDGFLVDTDLSSATDSNILNIEPSVDFGSQPEVVGPVYAQA